MAKQQNALRRQRKLRLAQAEQQQELQAAQAQAQAAQDQLVQQHQDAVQGQLAQAEQQWQQAAQDAQDLQAQLAQAEQQWQQAAQDAQDAQAQLAQLQQQPQAPSVELAAQLTATQELLRAVRAESASLYQRQDDLLGLATSPAARADVCGLSMDQPAAVARHDKLTNNFDGVLGRVEVGALASLLPILHRHSFSNMLQQAASNTVTSPTALPVLLCRTWSCTGHTRKVWTLWASWQMHRSLQMTQRTRSVKWLQMSP